VKDTYQTWRTKTDNDLVDTRNRLADLTRQEATAKTQLEADTKAHQEYFDKVRPQLAALEAQAAPLITARDGLRKPTKPRDKSTAGVKDPARRREIEQENDREEREYNRDLKEYEAQRNRLNAQIAPLERQAAPLYAQLTALQNKVKQTQTALEKIQKPLIVQAKNEQRLAKLVADQPTWETAGNLAALRALEAYSILSFPAEVDRINRTRNK
jgi:chromosome segregation ATPase